MRGEPLEGLVEGEEVDVRLAVDDEVLVELQLAPLAAALLASASARVIDEEVSHRLRCEGKELAPVAAGRRGTTEETELDLVDERGGLERVVAPLVVEVAAGHPSQLFVGDAQELVARGVVAGVGLVEELSGAIRVGLHGGRMKTWGRRPRHGRLIVASCSKRDIGTSIFAKIAEFSGVREASDCSVSPRGV